MGLIAPYAPGFCDSCNRLRVTARGRLRLCLFGEGGVDLRDLLARDDQRQDLIERIAAAMSGKRQGHRLDEGDPGDLTNLAQLGG
jgi:cyclic pyranopterin phosphate synthase